MEERKLAHIEIISDIKEIPNAQNIEIAVVLGWQCVVKKGEFKVGDKIIYVEVDSVLPDKPEYEFLRDRKFRIRTIKLKGQISQGLILPLPDMWKIFEMGTDVTNALGITKYLSPSEREEISSQEKVKHWTKNYRITKWLWRYKWFRNYIKPIQVKWWPEWISHTDEERIQNIPHVLEQFKDKEVYVTEKIDYQSVTFTGKIIPRFNNWVGIRIFNLINKL